MQAFSGSQSTRREYRFRSFDSEVAEPSPLTMMITIIDENRAAAALIATATFFITAFWFGYGAGGLVDHLLAIVAG